MSTLRGDAARAGVIERCFAEVNAQLDAKGLILKKGTLMDALIRLLPGVLGHEDSAEQDSYVDGLLDCPHYTRPEEIEGRTVPEVLKSGNHELIRRWRLQQALGRTWLRRPDLLEGRELSGEEQVLLDEFIRAQAGT